MPLFKKNTSLGVKLKEAVIDLSVDVFGYEKIISDNIINHTEIYAEKLRIPSKRLSLRIFQKNHTIKAFLYDQNKALLLIPNEELAYFFIDKGAAQITGTANKIAFNIKQYLKDFASANKIAEESIRIWINTTDDLVEVRAFKNQEFQGTISLNSLIKYFKK